jgi:hypothetical protein
VFFFLSFLLFTPFRDDGSEAADAHCEERERDYNTEEAAWRLLFSFLFSD